MDNDLVKILRELNEIKPDPDYTRRSRLLLMSEEKSGALPKFGFFDVLRTMTANRMILVAEITVILIIFILGGIYYLRQSNQNLIVQANELNATIQLTLNEITSYFNNPDSLNPLRVSEINLLLEKATSLLNEANANLETGKLEESLKNMESAREAFSQIESIIKPR